MIEAFKQNKFLVSLIMLVSLGVLIFNVIYYSKSYGIVEINNVNAMLLVPFIILVYWFGIALGTSKNINKFEEVYQSQLTNREKEVLTLISSGMKNREIADKLYVDITTIKSHINNIYKKTSLQNRKELKYYYQEVLEKVGKG